MGLHELGACSHFGVEEGAELEIAGLSHDDVAAIVGQDFVKLGRNVGVSVVGAYVRFGGGWVEPGVRRVDAAPLVTCGVGAEEFGGVGIAGHGDRLPCAGAGDSRRLRLITAAGQM